MKVNLHYLRDEMNRAEAAGPSFRQARPAVDADSSAAPALLPVSKTTVIGAHVAPALPSDQSRPAGIAFVASADLPGGRIYICDPDAHIIDVLDQNGRPLFSFGGFGSGLGQLDTPTDVAVVRLNTPDPTGQAVDTALLVVADHGNHRLQLFELDGAAIGEVGAHAGAWTPGRFFVPTGSPFFRLGDIPPLPFPSRLEWRMPYLDVACAGTMIRLDLAAVLLPDFTAWIADASPIELRLAFLRFGADPNRADIPDSCLYEIVERLQPAWRRAAVLPFHSRQ